MTGAAARAVAAVVAVVVVVGAVWRDPPAPPNAEPPGFAVPVLPSPHLPFVGTRHKPYNSIPPTSGPHVTQTVAPGVYRHPLAEELQVHALEHGHVLVQYGRETSPHGVDALEAVARRHARAVVVAPFPRLGAGISLTAWGRLERLDRVEPVRIEAFVASLAGRYVHGWRD